MPEPEAVASVRKFRAAVLGREQQAAAEMIRRYIPIHRGIQSEIALLLAEVAEKDLTFAQTQRLKRYRALIAQVERDVAKFAVDAGDLITQAQRDAVGIAEAGVRSTVDARLPVGISTDTLAAVGVEWNTLPAGAVEAFAGISGDGAPLGRLLAPLGQDTAQGVTEGISQGIARGFSPRKTAALITDKTGLGLTRSLLISRTETLRAYRESTRATYESNKAVVKGWQRSASKDGRTCPACLSLDGKQYETNEPIDSHPGCRCAMVPVTVTYADLGLDVPEDLTPPESAKQWFDRQPSSVQRDMLGKERYRQWQNGTIGFDDFVMVLDSPIWGKSAVTRPLSTPRKVRPAPDARFQKAALDADALPSPDTVNLEVQDKRDFVVQNQAKLTATGPDGKDLVDATRHWASGGNPTHRDGAEAWLKGARIPDSAGHHAGATLAEAVSVAPRIDKPLFRGVRINNRTIDEVENFYPVGKNFDAQIASWSTDTNLAADFAGSGVATGETSVVFNLESGARGLNIEPLSVYIGERERIIAGRFEVVGVRRVPSHSLRPDGTPGTRLHVDVRQTNTLVRQTLTGR